ncbi:acetate--CoA ligase [Rhodobacter sphaeroides]|jgi:acetyl-CoA synthetase|uniref:Acetyl-coenzyme A synthetase n=2 Tax=Cereibacter sphaeroides TaxID=1063 RepID=Q3J0D1_CERS4|nr:acetate--CoA ligase [Cereibacter sphaeroides]EKX59563.1 Acetyl-coenzyme A synthetase [Rhodobacter sp. AKP1]ABA79753.1 acetyl-coenzyme A synthetase [Cereibacter sphaeroides 2.4.1]ACM01779.1 Acetyl-coenzyme A synthetase [Cereibacter sphaeroides KD131]AMJ48036.1 acetyl-coenzyme A synthetase [Cereibacter sphaeroides]ANS34745.1 acetyl-coenzyme A synthetase [Cereibacter sphaeroides]
MDHAQANAVYTASADFIAQAHVDAAGYERMYAASVADPEAFWGEQGKRLDWIKPYTKVKNTNFRPGEVSIKWFEDGTLNIAWNCIDRHLATRAKQTAIIWEPDDPNVPAQHISYQELHDNVCRMANVLVSQGVRKGDRVVMYLPMIPEAAYAMLACARIGAIHSVVFAGFSPDALANRINDCQAKVVITADTAPRGGRRTPLKSNTDAALLHCSDRVRCLVVKHTGDQIHWMDGRDVDVKELMRHASPDCPIEEVNAEDPLFILYTSGSTGKPKGVVHTSGGYLTYAAMTHQMTFDYHDGDVFWCTADVGWVTGHSYIVYGPLANGATTLMFEGVPTYPDAGRFWAVCEKHKVNQFYTAPTAIRSLMGLGPEWVDKYDLSSLKLLGSVGEPINPEAWSWYNTHVGKGRCPIVDTFWQTETGGHMITPLPGAIPVKPGAASKPFFGVKPVILDPTDGHELHETATEGVLCIADSWPGQMRTLWGDHERFEEAYFSQYKGYYFTGDGCRRDADGYYWVTGRVDDVINVSGHRMGTAEVESALVAHAQVAEAAVVGYPHDIKGQGIYAYVTLMNGVQPTEELRKDLVKWVRTEIGPIASPDVIQWAPGLPKTRSGKIMRRILRKIAENDFGSLGDTTTLADPSVVDDLIANRKNRG